MSELVDHIPVDEVSKLYRDEPVHLMRERWETLTKSFYQKKTDTYDTTKITDIFDYVSYDVCYNQEALAPLDMYPLFTLCEVVSAMASDGEYGVTPEQKRQSGCLIATPLLQKILADLEDMSSGHSPRSRLYFSSESHLMGLKNILYKNRTVVFHRLEEPLELHFLTHFVFKLYRYVATGCFQLEVHFSAGIDKNMFGIVQEHHVEYSAVTPMIRIHNDLSMEALRGITSEYRELFEELISASSNVASPSSPSSPSYAASPRVAVT
jgi:hypothetical protein